MFMWGDRGVAPHVRTHPTRDHLINGGFRCIMVADHRRHSPEVFEAYPLRSLVIGYGNPSRRDDGVGLAVINGLRARLGQEPLDEGDDGYSALGGNVDTLFLQQLMPELVETLAQYDRLWFVDAHLGVYPELVRRTNLSPNYDPALVSHHLKPEALLMLAQQIYSRAPAAELISIRGFDFDFGEGLSPETAEGAQQVLDDLWRTIAPG
jgi:hydrogenase maturation protease